MALNVALPPFRDYQLAKRYRWDPEEIGLDQDASDWAALADDERDVLLNLCSLFLTGEEAVATELTPLLWAIGQAGGRREEEMFLTTQLFDESVHVEFFSRWLAAVVRLPVDREAYYGPSYRALFFDELPSALNALVHDPSAAAQARALTVYHITVEGMLAETGYHAIFQACEARGVLPGLRRGIELIKRDESRHIAYGLYALQGLIAADPALWPAVNDRLSQLVSLAIGIIPEAFARYPYVPFGLDQEQMVGYAMEQFGKRYARLTH
jgi:ribonucleoside-diphosphate reductase beta chain